ncbi:divalent-cation tolerance protein CutA [Delftia sp. PS-11]|uniref:divalent-cation tolerance protein CutA n=1 Tax=Delftia sp. PS-11 TaxID=2767222 RepID=UPI002457D16E|nr:divalent-cation tolerance protein CutA [Delftia sp. PS-11]KAJ8744958.1 divalent-cation tolerance protein CutA [Delftia sp. PS-11]
MNTPASDKPCTDPAVWSTLCVLTTTVASAQEAAELARALVRQQAAACVQVEAITSHYVWEGELHATPEWRLVCKTLPDALERLQALLRASHSYSVPQITVRTEHCLPDYAHWLRAQVLAA